MGKKKDTASGAARGAAANTDAAFQSEYAGLAHPEPADGEDERDLSLRPKRLNEFLGQQTMKENLLVFISAARERGESLDHLFLIGPPGLGKTTLAQVVANELETGFV
jgi:Holliday junction DNA helicase RuvB